MAVPVVLLGIVSLAYGYRIHLSNRWQNSVDLPVRPPEGRSERILVFAPHCDDETLGVGGSIRHAVRSGAKVQVVLMTNGDGFGVAAQRAMRKLVIKPDQYIKFAYNRQQETLEALSILGVPKESVVFLGYPDRGLARLWTEYWGPENLYKSFYTKHTSSPYKNSYRPNAPYCGESVLDDIESLIRNFKPTTIYLPHPSDAHADHYATYCFVVAALEQLKAWQSGNIVMRTYLVHRGDWPVPKGYQPKLRLSPPFGLAKTGTKWEIRPIDPETVALKRKAILAHKSQVAIMKNFLLSFARGNELFGEVKTRSVPRVRRDMIKIDGHGTDWGHIPPCIQDPTGDNVIRDLYKAADVNSVYMCSDSSRLYVRVDFVRNISKRIHYRVRIRAVDSGEESEIRTVEILPGKRTKPERLKYAWRNRTMEFSIPLGELADENRLFLSVETARMGASIDRTGWRVVDIAPLRESSAALSDSTGFRFTVR